MYKLLIVDDDMLARMGMMSLIDWNAYGYQVIGAVDSGEEALKIMEKECPDVVFTDVVMHGMDGVELTRQIKARFPHVLVVALSCYSDISYVKDIIRLGAEDYLQKLSMRPDKVVSMLKACTAKLNARSSGPQEDRKRKHADALIRMIGSGAREGELKALMGERECPVRFMVLCAKTGEDPAGRLNLAEAALDGRGYVSCRFRENAVAALIPDAPEDRLRAQAREILACGGPAEGQGNDPLCVGWGDAFSREDDLQRCFAQADAAAQAFYLADHQDVFFFRPGDKEQLHALYSQCEQINRLLEEHALSDVRRQIPELTRKMKALEGHALLCRRMYNSLFLRLDALIVEQGGELSMQPACPSREEGVEQAQQAFLNRLNHFMESPAYAHAHYRREVRMIMDYIRENYAQEITLRQLAQHVSMSESYLSSVFRKETGKTLVNYLEEYRIAQAVRLMAHGNRTLTCVAGMVGYANINYFSRVFKKVRGESPGRFMRRKKFEHFSKNPDESSFNGNELSNNTKNIEKY